MQPPVHAIAVQRILDQARTRGRSTRTVAEAFLDRRWADLVRWHRWLAEARDQHEHGRITLYHGWESGMDNSPRWDSAYANVIPGSVPEYQREDNAIVTDASQRPSDIEYDRYLWLLEEMKAARYDDDLLPKVMSFVVEDVVSAILSVAAMCSPRSARTRNAPMPTSRICTRGRSGSARASSERPTNAQARQGISTRAERWVATEPSRSSLRCCAADCRTTRNGAAAAAGGPAVLWAPGSQVCADPVDITGVAGLRLTRVLARSGVAGDDVAVLIIRAAAGPNAR
jgi:hypothetical protein